MTLSGLMAQLVELNIKIRAEGERLHVDAPVGVLTAALKDALRRHKDALLKSLQKAAESNAQLQWPKISADFENRYEPFPLSDVQHAYWVGRTKGVELGDVATHYYFELSCDDLDIARFNQALRQLIDRHEMLRAIVDHDGRQRILNQVHPYDINVIDLRDCAAQIQEAQMGDIRASMSHQKLATDRSPMFDIRAVRLNDSNTRVYFSLDFLNLDAWSLFSLFREWKTLYRDSNAALPVIDVSYRDYVLTEYSLRDSELYRRDREYWWSRLDSIPGAPLLPVRSTTEAGVPPLFVRRRVRLVREKWNTLKANAQAIGVTPSGILLTAFAEVLAYWSKEPHFSLNMTTFSRLPLHGDVNKLVGDFTSLTLLEVDMRQRVSFRDRAIATQQQFLKDFEHRLVSGVEVMREWTKRKERTLQAVMPVVFTSCLALNTADGDDAGLLESFGPMVYGISQTPQVWLDCQVMEDHEGLFFNWDAREAVFLPDILESMFECYLRFLERLAESPALWDQKHPLDLPENQQIQRHAVNDTKALIYDHLLHEPFIERALSNLDRIALITSTLEMSYGELLARSVVVAERLQELGVATNQLVAIVIDKGWEQIVSVFGILIAGGAYVPIDPELPKARRQQLFEQSNARFALIKMGSAGQLDLPKNVCGIEVEIQAPVKAVTVPPKRKQCATDLAYVIFTSGSTGVPKGVMIDHQGAVNTVRHINRLFDVNENDKTLAVSSLSFDLSVYDIFGLLGEGGSVVIPEAERSTDPEHWLELISHHGVTLWNSAPPLMSMLISYMEGFQKTPNTSVRLTMLSGDWIPVPLKSKTDVLFPKTQLISLGGATEASIWSIYYPITHVAPQWTSIPYGKPLPNQSMHVLNDQRKPCPVNAIGDIYIGGMGVALGYLNDVEKTNKHFVDVDGERLYYTGDVGRYLTDGNIEFLGREDSQIKLRGHRIELGEISAALRAHPAIDDALVVVDGDSRTEQALWAYLQLSADNKSMLMKQMTNGGNANQYSPAVIATAVAEDEKITPGTALTQDARDLWRKLDDLYLMALISMFRSSALFNGGNRYTVDDLMGKMRIAPRYRRWLQRAVRHLVSQNLLTEEGGQFSAVRALPEVYLSQCARDVEQCLTSVLSFTQREARWVTSSAESLADIVTESTHSAELYTADETALIYQKLFPDSHIQLQRATSALVSARQREKLRVLEVGGGLGSATRHLLPSLAGHCESYAFTDLSNYFLKKAKDTFAGYEFVQHRIYDLEKPAAHQGYETQTYDLIIGSSVLHDVSDVTKTLGELRGLLAPGGILMLLEETKFFPWFDLTMGLQQGFDVFADENIRKHHPLLARDQWKTLIQATGFSSVEVLNIAGSAADYLGFDVIVAQASATGESLDEELLDGYLLDRLPAYMKPAGYQLLSEFPVTSNGKIDYKALARPLRIAKREIDTVGPSNDMEQTLMSIWCGVLEHDSFDVNSSFFEIGGDSLTLVEVRNEIRQKLGKHVPTTTLFEYPTISKLSKHLASEIDENTKFDDIQDRASKQRKAMSRQRVASVGRGNE